jgi:hypothetical protein
LGRLLTERSQKIIMVEVLLGGSARRMRRPWWGDTAFERKGTDLIDDGGALTDEPFSDAMQRLEVALVAGLDGDEFHRRAPYGLGNRFGVIEIVLLSLSIRTDILRGHQPSVVAEGD